MKRSLTSPSLPTKVVPKKKPIAKKTPAKKPSKPAKVKEEAKAPVNPPKPTAEMSQDTMLKLQPSQKESVAVSTAKSQGISNSSSGGGLASKLKSTPVDTAPHLIVEARAGTGKTTTLSDGLKRVKGVPSTLVPSPQQAAVWEQMELSKGFANSICFCAFNKSIAEELKTRVPQGCDAMTMHSMGLKSVTAMFGRVNVDGKRVESIIAEILQKDIWELRRHAQVMLAATQQLTNLCKMNLVNGSETELDDLCSHYEIDLNGSRTQVYDLVPKVLERCKEVKRDNTIDHADMIWLPVILNLPVIRYDMLLVDEAQDLNRCQQALAKRAGKRLILCGDPKQAIYGFAGADSESMNRMYNELKGEDKVSCVVLPLTVTRRCGKAIVREAQKIVPDFEAFETNPEGKITYAKLTKGEDSYQKTVNDGDMILCRCNAPLVSECFRFLKAGRKATIQGRDVGTGLISTINKLMKSYQGPEEIGVVELISRLGAWLHSETAKENAKRNPSESKLINMQDRYDCLMCFCDGLTKVSEVTDKINAIFTDDRSGKGINLSSGHKAKGLESKRVFILQLKGASCPHPMAKSSWQRDQEYNLLYVMTTRAIEELIYVTDGE